MWRLATRESADFQKQSADFHLTAQHFTHSAETFCLATREQQAKHAPVLFTYYIDKHGIYKLLCYLVGSSTGRLSLHILLVVKKKNG